MNGDLSPVVVEDLVLEYRVPRHQASSLKETLVRIAKRGIQYDTLRAVDGVSFEVQAGEVLGIVGPNGAGKSTLMKVMARVLPPTSGRVRVRGRVSPMIELGAGFNGEQTGRENVILYGTLLGRDAKHMKSRCAAIAEWAGLSDYLDVPVRAYSSGMVARLAFSVAVDVEPTVLLIDEILAVGDAAFQVKSSQRMGDLIGAGAAVVLVSHQLGQVMERCDRVLWLDHGVVKALGAPTDVVGAYADAAGVPFGNAASAIEQAHAEAVPPPEEAI
ncbi:MAG TPA: ABC transporter ATP-binding protein [Acidimicrobiales bacterium]|nr:ABC transporter ATP-binding protein [Acidimicrobiales bacterium]